MAAPLKAPPAVEKVGPVWAFARGCHVSGTLIQVLGTGWVGKGEGVFNRPEGVEIRGDTIWLSDTYNDRVVRYRFTARSRTE
jgi:hypothetical protein